MAQPQRIADITPSELRGIIQSGVMVGMIGVYAFFAIVALAIYFLSHAL